VLGERQLSALGEAREALARATALATAAIARGARGAEPVELVADELRRVLDALAVVAGRRTPDDVLAEVFARFCVGK
jgi:tRNA modification GTPase